MRLLIVDPRSTWTRRWSRSRHHLVLWLAIWVGLTGCATRPTEDPIASAMANADQAARPGELRAAYCDLRSGRTVLYRGEEVVHAASTMKIAVMIEVFRRADAGLLDQDDVLPVVNRFASIVDGSPYELSGLEDSESDLYAHLGQGLPIHELVRRMIVQSSNLATNLLIAELGAPAVQTAIESLGTRHMQVRRGVEDTLAFERGLNNVTTAEDLLILLRAIAENHAASPTACATMRQVLLGQEHRDVLPAGLPIGTPVAHKTGQISTVLHDAGIVDPYGPHPYVLVLLSTRAESPSQNVPALVELTRTIHELHTRSFR